MKKYTLKENYEIDSYPINSKIISNEKSKEYCYVVYSELTGLYKIGITNDEIRRLKEISTSKIKWLIILFLFFIII